jgi:flagellar M-ring protein FliF
MLLLGVVRPALRPDPPPPPPPEPLSAVADETEELPALTAEEQLALDAPKVQQQLTDAREMAKLNPLAVANILRTWIDGEAA